MQCPLFRRRLGALFLLSPAESPKAAENLQDKINLKLLSLFPKGDRNEGGAADAGTYSRGIFNILGFLLGGTPLPPLNLDKRTIDQ